MSRQSLTATDITLRRDEFKLFQKLIYDQAGIHMSDVKHALVQSRLKKRLAVLNLNSYREYYDLIHENESEFQECLNALTTNETYFFRHKNHWDFFLKTVVPEWKQAHKPGDTFRFWSAASSSGEEPYSAAIALYDAFVKGGKWKAAIDATDLNLEVLRRAEQGVYGAYAVQKMTNRCIKQYMVVNEANDTYEVLPVIRKLVNFRTHNLLNESHGISYDVVFLRNVMIYFDNKSKTRVMENITKRIKHGGYLVLGGAETLAACHDTYTYVRPTIYRKL